MIALEVAMEKKGWSVTQTSLVTGVTDQSLRNLLRRGETRDTIPGNVTAFTMIRLLEAFPTLDLKDFVAGTPLSIRRRNARQT